MRLFLLVILVAFLFVVGCGGDGGEAEEQSNSVNSGEDDAGEQENEGENCEVVNECSEDQCGEIDDGCGGVLSCGACSCVDGVATTERCGICGLGTTICDEGETGEASCDEPEIPGAQGCEDLVFVDKSMGSDSGAGTKEDPLKSLRQGVEAAKSGAGVAVILAWTPMVEYEGPVLLEEPISIIGGFDRYWKANGEQPTIVGGPGAPWLGEEDIAGISVRGVDEEERKMVLANFAVRNVDAVDGGSNYGVHMHDSSGVILRNLDVKAGEGGAGADGLAGESGEDGEPGGFATDTVYHRIIQQGMLTSYITTGTPGAGGVNEFCPEANGGAGGEGGTYGHLLVAWGPDGRGGEDGRDVDGGGGGYFGAPSMELRSGWQGWDGPAFEISHGEHGEGGEVNGMVEDGRWVPRGTGMRGGDGEHGSGGGGGGGGASGWTSASEMRSGPHGGGGSAGGCGGKGGWGGEGGGGSFGLFVSSSSLLLEASDFRADVGGAGGAGGVGGSGGEGGSYVSGRAGGSVIYGGLEGGGMNPVPFVQSGGFGGLGADGQDGGAGGGGAGGVSYGAYCFDSHIRTHQNVEYAPGGAGLGGAGEGLPGANGESKAVVQCD